MPNLNDKQIQFLSKYLKVVSKKGFFKSSSKRKKAVDFNDLVKQNYVDFLDRKKAADRILAEIKKTLAERKESLGAISPNRGGQQLVKFRESLAIKDGEYDKKFQEVMEENSRVMNAAEKKPVFASGIEKMDALHAALITLQKHIPDAPPLINDGVLGALYSQRAKITPLEAFKDNKFLNERIVAVELSDKDANDIRIEADIDHANLCTKAYNDITHLIRPILGGNSDLTADAGATATAKILSDLMVARQVPIRKLVDVIKAAANGKLSDLVNDNNEIALREKKRSDEIAIKLEKLKKQLAALTTTVGELKKEQSNATGFKEKQGITKKFENALSRLDSMTDYIAQLGAYDDQLALRIERIAHADNEDSKGQALVSDPDRFIREAEITLKPMNEEHAMVLLMGGLDDSGKKAAGIYDNLLDQFTRASKRVSVDVKLFPGEKDLFDISAAQLATLTDMLEAGKEMAGDAEKLIQDAQKASPSGLEAKVKSGQAMFAKAKFMFDEARKLFGVFNASNKFPLPDTPEVEIKDKDRIAKVLKSAIVELDRFWGIGGDTDDAIRKLLTKAGNAYEKALNGNMPYDFDATDASLDRFQKALEAGRKAFQPSPQDQDAKDKAAAARDLVVESLLKLYKTKELSESQIGDIPLDHLLVVERNGKKEYHEILTKGNGDEINRRDDKDIPREAVNLLLEQATMLELLAKSEAPGCADAIAKAIEESEKKRAAIVGGKEHFKQIIKYIAECKKLLGEKTLVQWVPAGLQAAKVNYETFKTEYPTKYLPDIGETKAKEFFDLFTKMIKDSDKVRVAYTEVDKLMVQLEKDFDNKKGAATPNLSTQFAAILKAGPQALMGSYTSAPDETREITELLENMKASMKEITDIDKKPPVDGQLKPRIKSARTTLETKSANGIATAKRDIEAIRSELDADINKLKGPVGLQYLKDLAVFLKNQAKAATEAKAALTEMQDKKKAVKELLEDASAFLKSKNKANFKSYKEYKTIYDSLKTQYQTAGKTYDKDKNVKSAASEYKSILPNATQLIKDLSRLCVVWKPGQKIVSFSSMQNALDTKIQSVREGAKASSEKAIDEASDDIKDIIDRTAEAAKTLAIGNTDAITKMVQLKAGLQDQADIAINTQDETLRIKRLGIIREKALAEVRRIRAETENHPALKIYRDNPFVKDVSWPAFAGVLHNFDVQILTTLQPK